MRLERVRYTYGVDIYPPPPLKGWVELETLGRVVEELFPISLVFLFLSTVHDLLCVYMHYPLNTIIFFFFTLQQWFLFRLASWRKEQGLGPLVGRLYE